MHWLKVYYLIQVIEVQVICVPFKLRLDIYILLYILFLQNVFAWHWTLLNKY